MRAIWSGSISFGLINIPVKLYSGSESRGGIELKHGSKE
jgi:non-homologous end joining protein Ku